MGTIKKQQTIPRPAWEVLATALFDVEAAVDLLVQRGALFVVSHSGGKDSQAMYLLLKQRVPKAQLVVVHAHLPEVEWDHTIPHIRRSTKGTPYVETQSVTTFFEMTDRRQKFPSPSIRQCTSDLKRGPIERAVRRYMKDHPEFGGLVVSCEGMRAEESAPRSKLKPFSYDVGNSLAGREWYTWLPIFTWKTSKVFATIHAGRQKPFYCYRKGMRRKSCPFCIYSSEGDFATAARLVPEMYQKYARREVAYGFTLSMSRRTLPEITGVPVEALVVPT
jgi:DNA sulfur modification protein DndC